MSKKILVVDDSDIERMYLLELLGHIEDISYNEAAGFEEAMQKLEQEKYDLLIIDYYLSEGTGEELLKRISSGNPSGNGETNAVAMGHDADFGEESLKESGFINYIEKPVEFNMLRAAINMYSKVNI